MNVACPGCSRMVADSLGTCPFCDASLAGVRPDLPQSYWARYRARWLRTCGAVWLLWFLMIYLLVFTPIGADSDYGVSDLIATPIFAGLTVGSLVNLLVARSSSAAPSPRE